MPALMRRPGSTWVAIVLLAAAAAVIGASHGSFKDLLVYQYAGDAVLHGSAVYGSRDPVNDLPFTYPPFAAVLMVPLAPLPPSLVATLWTAASTAALAGTVVVVRHALGREMGRPAPGWLVLLLGVGAFAWEPVWQNAAFGQVNTFLLLAVVYDVLGPRRRTSGVLVGLAAGVKLTPLVFVAFLVLAGRRTDAARAALTFAGTVVVGHVLLPGTTAAYWSDDLFRPSRIGPPALAHNQSVLGALARLLDGPPPTVVWLAISIPVCVAVLLVGVACWRAGDRVLGLGVASLAMLLASPVSWSHHWVWAVPLALALWERSRWAAVAWSAVFVARPILWPPWGEHREYAWSVLDHVVGNAYVLAAVTLAACLAGSVARSRPGTGSPVESAGDAHRRTSSSMGSDPGSPTGPAGDRLHRARRPQEL